MVVAAVLAFSGGMATFAQVLLALPMALDLLGPFHFRHCQVLTSSRSSVLPPSLPPLRGPSLPLLDPQTPVQKHTLCTPHHHTLLPLALHQLISNPPHLVLLPPSA